MTSYTFQEKMMIESLTQTGKLDELLEMIEKSEELTEMSVKDALSTWYGVPSGIADALSTTQLATLAAGEAVARGGVATTAYGIIASGGAVAFFPWLLTAVGGGLIVSLTAKKIFRVLFLRKVKSCLGDKVHDETKDLLRTIITTPDKTSSVKIEADARLVDIKDLLLKKKCK